MSRNAPLDAGVWANLWKDAAARFWTGLHEAAFRASNGLFFNRVGGMPVILLTTTGRKSGKTRTVPIMYIPDGASYVVIGSNGGMDRHPGWYHNLKRQPEARVQVGRRQVRVRAEEVRGTERDRL